MCPRCEGKLLRDYVDEPFHCIYCGYYAWGTETVKKIKSVDMESLKKQPSYTNYRLPLNPEEPVRMRKDEFEKLRSEQSREIAEELSLKFSEDNIIKIINMYPHISRKELGNYYDVSPQWIYYVITKNKEKVVK